MRVLAEIMRVPIPARNSFVIYVPGYEVPLVKAAWKGHLHADEKIVEQETGQFEERDSDAELERLTRDWKYATGKVVFPDIYGGGTVSWERELEIHTKASEAKLATMNASLAAAQEAKTLGGSPMGDLEKLEGIGPKTRSAFAKLGILDCVSLLANYEIKKDKILKLQGMSQELLDDLVEQANAIVTPAE